MQNKSEKISRHCGRGPAIQGCYKEKTTLLNRLDPGSMSGMTTRNAFTLIELLVVVLIIGILAAVAVPQYQKAVLKAKYTQVLILGRSLQDAVNMYYLANNKYPLTLDGLDIQFEGTLSANKKEVTATGKYLCYLDIRSNSYDSLWCELLGVGGELGLRVNTANSRYCVAQGAQREEICKLVGGTNPFDNGTGIMHYRLP